jgi:hypothetical protein
MAGRNDGGGRRFGGGEASWSRGGSRGGDSRVEGGRRWPVIKEVLDGHRRGHKGDRVASGPGELRGPGTALGVVAAGTVHGRR